MNKPDLTFHLIADNSSGMYNGTREWQSSNLKIFEQITGGPRQGLQTIYQVFHKGKLLKEIPFSYTGSLKEELSKLEIAQ